MTLKVCPGCGEEKLIAKRYCSPQCWYGSAERKLMMAASQLTRATSQRRHRIQAVLREFGLPDDDPVLLAVSDDVYGRAYDAGRRSMGARVKVTSAERHTDVIAVDPHAESHASGLRARRTVLDPEIWSVP